MKFFSVNFLEFGARSEGLEQLMDSLTGPDGYFTNPNGYLFREKSAEHKNTKVRSLHDLYKKRGNVRNNDHLAASTYIKVKSTRPSPRLPPQQKYTLLSGLR